jgi:hypothetical protein
MFYARKPFRLDTVPLVRAVVAKRSVWGPLLLLVTHHIATDLWSLVVTLEDLANIYQVRS